jgi:hypothetical protein
MDMETIDLYVAMVMPLMSIIPERITDRRPKAKRPIDPPTPEQWAKRAERLALIGLEGEKFVMEFERQRLADLGVKKENYPRHVALDSLSANYDILSWETPGNELYIEVKTTTLPKKHPLSRTFFLSAPEYAFYQQHKARYKLLRVWDVYGTPSIEEIDLADTQMENDGFRVTIK